jgi:hypothetical protein
MIIFSGLVSRTDFFIGTVEEKGEDDDQVDVSGFPVFQRISQHVVLFIDIFGNL